MRIQRGMRGFTLIELAIVLVIIGLIIGAILKGGELIQSAKYKRLKMDWDAVLTAVYTYQDKYGALPGDDLNALANLPTAVYPEADPEPGNGDGVIDNEDTGYLTVCTGAMTGENCQAWWHMRLAGLLPGSSTTAPTHSFGGGMAIGRTLDNFSTWSNPWAVCHYNLQRKVARWLDEHYDDGEYTTGSIRGTQDYTTTDTGTSVWTCLKGG